MSLGPVSDSPVYGIMDPDYAAFYSKARCVAWTLGYALAVHGSFTRDLDVVAIPWAPKPCDPEELVERIAHGTGMFLPGKAPTLKPHGRLVWILLFPQPEDPRWVDFSVMPFLRTAKNQTDDHQENRSV